MAVINVKFRNPGPKFFVPGFLLNLEYEK